MRRVPFAALQTAIYNILKNYQSTPVYDYLSEDAKAPYIILGAFTCRDVSTKDIDITTTSVQIEIYSEYEGRKEINKIANDVATVLSAWPLNLEDGFKQYDNTQITMFEAYPGEEHGYNGAMTVEVKILNKQ